LPGWQRRKPEGFLELLNLKTIAGLAEELCIGLQNLKFSAEENEG